MRILVVEDEQDLLNVIAKRLEAEYYSVDSCEDGLEAIDYIEMANYDAIILDVMLPGITGLEVLKKMREAQNSTPVLLLTAKDTVEDRVTGLDLGADDYLTKPFAFDELLARLRVLTRRRTGHVSNVFKLADLEVDCSRHSVTRSGEPVEVSSKEFAILEYMIRNQGIVLSRDNIQQHVWNYDYEGGSNIVDVYIRYLRRKIDSNHDAKLIHTIRGAGYVLREEQ